MNNTFLDAIFRDDKGNFVIIQPPNLPIIIWFTASILKLVFSKGNLYTGLDFVAVGALTIWSFLEIFQGVNYFRKGLGVVVLIGLIASRI
ncbi:hypothetical protein [Chamaesiphon sp.]|uniref:hypothetical protein n=1 Tax=Chamaesiphon sp. TaxID=2814140 RepID=UPI0035941FA7